MILSLLLLLLVFVVSFHFFGLKPSTNSIELNLPPSPPRFPITGNLHQLLGTATLPHGSLQALSKKYGPLMYMHLGYSPTLVVSSAEIAREIIKNHDIVFSNRPKTTAANVFLYGCQDIGFSPYGEYWRQARKTCVLGLLSTRNVKSLQAEEETAGKCNKFGELSRRILVQFVSFSFGDMLPYLGWLDVVTGLIGRLTASSREVDVLFDQVIEKHRISGSDDDHPNRKDLDMFVGGTETTSTTVEWAMAELISSASSSFGSSRDTSINLRGYDIPARVTVYLNAWAIQRDPKVWKRAEEFLPERFMNNTVDFKGQDFEFIPFGAGRRGCPGMSFALAAVEYLLTNLLYYFDWKLPDVAADESLDMTEVHGLTVHKKFPLLLVPALYSPKLMM
ncbi:cytochrome P450 71A25 [Citrus sinensis]|uniref:Cytochrome P450 71A25 n=1 Tax=Citrus sinensis TaxID=2711 RepID=A0ACB8LSS1_CITSI|nr:cytochrome P450 71A25 [Citrus sinensis]